MATIDVLDPGRQECAPGPSLIASMRHALRLKDNALDVLPRLQAEHGDVVRLTLPPIPGNNLRGLHAIFHPSHLKYVLTENWRNYTKGDRYVELERVIGRGLVSSEGELWVKQRQLVGKEFLHAAVAAYVAAMVEPARQLLASWDARPRPEEPLEMCEEAMRVSFEIAAKILLGLDLSDHAQEVRDALGFALVVALRRMNTLVKLPMSMPTPAHRKFRRSMKVLDDLVYGIIDGYRAEEERPTNVLSRLMAARDSGDGAMSREQLRDELMTALMVSHETSSSAIAWAFYMLATEPEAEARVLDELRTVLGGRPPTAADLPKLNVLRMFFLETMRLRPPIPFFFRSPKKDDEVGGYRIPAGSIVTLVPYVTHRHPEFWDKPDRFNLDRFTPEAAAARHKFAFFPFSHGARTCIGDHFAMIEAQVILATIIPRYQFRLVPGREVVPQAYITLRPRGGLPMFVTRRDD